MDLVKLNNEISGMRPCAIQSRVRVIHHLTRKAEQFRKKYGTEEAKASYEKKAERLMQEALIDKILTPDEIIKFSLQFDSSLRDDVLNDINIPLSAKAFVRIATHDSMAKGVEKFREKYPDWNKWLEKSLEKLGTGSRFGSKMKNGRVKAHMQQRQRVEEAIDTIRRAQMSRLHNLGSKNIKVKATDTVESRSENKEVENNKKVKEGNEVDSSDAENEDNKLENNSEDSDNSEVEKDSFSALPVAESIPSRLNKKMKLDNIDKAIADHKQVVYEEVDADESSDEEIRHIKNKSAVNKNQKQKGDKKELASKKSTVINQEDYREKCDTESADEKQSDKSTDNGSEDEDQSEEWNQSENDSEAESDPIDKKTVKKLANKDRRKQKVVVPRSRDAQVCKFSELLKKSNQSRQSDSEVNGSDSDDESNPSKSAEKGVDPFFMTRNNDFLRLATAKRETKPEEPERRGPKWGIEGSENWTGTRSERRARARRLMGVPDPVGFRRRAPPKFNSPSLHKFKENTHDLSSPPANYVNQDIPEKLHPSWEAKRKMNISSVGFQGKKVKFDD